MQRLITRHLAFDKTRDAAQAWATGNDQRNADTVAATAHHADLVLRL